MMVKCDSIGCMKEATKHAKTPVCGGMMMAEIHGCDEHFNEIMMSLEGW